MATHNKVVLGIYKSRPEVEACVTSLKADGFVTNDISVLMPNSAGSQDFGHTKGSKAPEGAATGATTGAVVGGTLGLLAGIGALVGLGIPEYEAKRYEGYIKDGGILLSVSAASSDEVKKAKSCLERCGASDISSTDEVKGEWKSPNFPVDTVRSGSLL